MKRLLISALLGYSALMPAIAQTPSDAQQQQLLALIKEVESQQKAIIDNQAKIDAKLVDLSETIRVARIFASKAGK